MKNSNISWCFDTMNFWFGCTKCSSECLHCYINRPRAGTPAGFEPFQDLRLSKTTWSDPYHWNAELAQTEQYRRIFTNSLSDFFDAAADNRSVCPSGHESAASMALTKWHRYAAQDLHDRKIFSTAWRDCAWQVIRSTPHLVYLILTKRPENILRRLPAGWPDEFPNVWLGTSVGCKRSLSKLESLRKVPMHPNAVRFVSCEPLLENIAWDIDLGGIGWVICGGESGSNPAYYYDSNADWKAELKDGATRRVPGHRTMDISWAADLRYKAQCAGVPMWFKQISGTRSGLGEDALGEIVQEVPPPPSGVWDEKAKNRLVVLEPSRDPSSDAGTNQISELNGMYLEHDETVAEVRNRPKIVESMGSQSPGLPPPIAVRTQTPRRMSQRVMKAINEARKRRLITWNEKSVQPLGLLRPSHFNSKFHLTGKAPALVVSKGWVCGWWSLYAASKTGTKGRLHGSYPRQFLHRALALFPHAKDILHVPSGTLGNLPVGHVTMDLKSDATRKPMVVGDCCERIPFPDGTFDLILSDPPYSRADSKLYECPPFRTMDFFREAYRVLRPGGYLGFLHLHLPQIRKPEDQKWRMRGVITVTLGSHKKARAFSLWQRL